MEWEYKLINFSDESKTLCRYDQNHTAIENILNNYGRSGWELVTVSTNGENAVFKRPYTREHVQR